jgi:hypothetical protein
MVKCPAFLLAAAMEVPEAELLVWHPKNVKEASAAMSKPQKR